jgi:hypothetical protein
MEKISQNYCIMPEQPYCPVCHYGYIVYDENDDTHCEWNCLLTEEEYKKECINQNVKKN